MFCAMPLPYREVAFSCGDAIAQGGSNAAASRILTCAEGQNAVPVLGKVFGRGYVHIWLAASCWANLHVFIL